MNHFILFGQISGKTIAFEQVERDFFIFLADLTRSDFHDDLEYCASANDENKESQKLKYGEKKGLK